MRSYGVPYGQVQRQRAPGSCWTECMLWRTVAKLLESLRYFWRGSLENRPDRPRVLWRTVDSGPRFSGEPPDSRTHRPVPDRIQRPGQARNAPVLGRSTGRILEQDMVQRDGNATNSSVRIPQDRPPNTSPSSLRQQPLRPKVDDRRPVRPPSGSEMNPKRTLIAAGRTLRAPSRLQPERPLIGSFHSMAHGPRGQGICLARTE